MVALVLGLMLSQSGVGIFFAERAVVMLRIGNPDTLWKGPIPMIMGYLGTFVYALPLAILLVMLIEPFIGASPGKMLLHLRAVSEDGAAVPSADRWHRAAFEATPVLGLVIALLAGSWQIAVIACLTGVALIIRALWWLVAPATHH